MSVSSSGDGLGDNEYQGRSISLYIWHAGTWTVKLDGQEGYRVLPVLAREHPVAGDSDVTPTQRRSSTHSLSQSHTLTHTLTHDWPTVADRSSGSGYFSGFANFLIRKRFGKFF